MKFYRRYFSRDDIRGYLSKEEQDLSKTDEFTSDLVSFGFLNTDGTKSFVQRGPGGSGSDNRPVNWNLKWYKDPYYLTTKKPDDGTARMMIELRCNDSMGNMRFNAMKFQVLYGSTNGSIEMTSGSVGSSINEHYFPFWFIPLKGGGFIISTYQFSYPNSENLSIHRVNTLKYNTAPPFLTPNLYFADPYTIYSNKNDSSQHPGTSNRQYGIVSIIGVPNHIDNDMIYFLNNTSISTNGPKVSTYVYDAMTIGSTVTDLTVSKIPYIDRKRTLFAYGNNQTLYPAETTGFGGYETWDEWYEGWFEPTLNQPYDTVDINQNVCTLTRMPYNNTFFDNIYLLSTAPNDRLMEGQFFSFGGRNFLCVYNNLVLELPAN